MNNLKRLAPIVGDKEAKEILKLTDNYDKYVSKFKKSLNALLEPHGYEVKVGIAFTEKEQSSGD